MKKIILSLACLAIMASCSNQETKQPNVTQSESAYTASTASESAPGEGAAFKFIKESYDFGQITEGEKVSYDFKFTNVGKTPLIITSATATCGCTVPDYPKEPVAPGADGIIKVVFDSSGKLGMQNKVITITANTIPEMTQVNILGNVVKASTAK